jgi:pimeloyl-ACP methyl ester carboxylesterase
MAMMLDTDPRGAAAALRGRAERPDYRPLLRELDLPVLVLTGDQDGYSTAEITDRLTSCLRRSHRVTLSGVGHLPNLETPARFNAELLTFLEHAATTGNKVRSASDPWRQPEAGEIGGEESGDSGD